MKTFNLLVVVNNASCESASGKSIKYYVNGNRCTFSAYAHIELLASRQDSFKTKIKGHIVRHYKTVYL